MDKELALYELRQLYEERGYIKVKRNPHQPKVRSGWEIRLVVSDEAKVARTIEELANLDFRPGRPFAKRKALVVPLYGLMQVRHFLELIQPAVKTEIPVFPPTDMRYHYPPKMSNLDVSNLIKGNSKI